MVGIHLRESKGDNSEDDAKGCGDANNGCDKVHYLSLGFNQDRVIGSHLY